MARRVISKKVQSITEIIPKSPDRFIGLDLSLTSTGVAITSKLTGFKFETFTIQSKLRGVERLGDIEYEINTHLDDIPVSYKTLAAIEGYSFGSQAGREASGELGGVVKLALWHDGVNFVIIPPGTLKKYATGKGNYSKTDLPLFCYKKWGVEYENSDELDAFLLCRLAASLWRPELMKYDYERQVVEEINKKWNGWITV